MFFPQLLIYKEHNVVLLPQLVVYAQDIILLF